MTLLRRISGVFLLLLILLPGPSLADLADYGVVAGTVNYDTITDISLTKSPHLEPQQSEGKYPHYMFYVNTTGGQYQCVIDIFSRTNTGDKRSINYRVTPLDPGNQDWVSVLNLADGYHQLPRDASHGALDYIRHPGINKDAMTLPWTQDPNFVVGVNLPAFDNLFKDVRHVWAFGQPYTSGLGIHNIHQNQGNVPSYVPQAPQGPNGEDHSAANGIWQDGGVILEYDPIAKWVPGFFNRCDKKILPIYMKCKNPLFGMFGHFVLIPNRKLLMTQFHVQEDFTFDTNASQDGFNFKPGDGYTPEYLDDFKIGGISPTYPMTIGAGGPPMEGQHSSVNGLTKKISIKVMPISGHPVLFGRIGAPPTQNQFDAKSDQPIGNLEIIHAYSASPQVWYWRVYNLDSGASTFSWEEFDDNF